MNQEKTEDDKQKNDQNQIKKQSPSAIFEFIVNGKINIHIKQKSNISSIALQYSFISLNIVHTIFSLLITSNTLGFSLTQLLGSVEYFKLYRITYIIIIALKTNLILSLYLQIIYFGQQIVLASWISRKTIESYAVLKEIDLSFTAFLCYFSLRENLPLLVISSAIYIMHAIYLQNYVIRKELAYSTSFVASLTFRFFIVLNYALNLNQTAFNSYYGCLAIMSFIWYLNIGYKLYPNQTLSKIFLFIMAAFIAVYVKILEDLILNNRSLSSKEITKILLAFITLVCSFSLYLHRFSFNRKKSSLKQYDLYLNKLLQDFYLHPNSQAQLLGLLEFDKRQWKNVQNFYDPYLKTTIKSKDFYIQKQSVVRRYIKKCYELLMQDSIESLKCQYYLQFCQYLCNYDLNYCEIYKCFQKINECSLDIAQRNKVNHMKALVEQSNGSLNKLLFNGKLALQTLIESQNCFAEIQQSTLKYITQNMYLWQLLQQQSIQLSQFRKSLKTSLQIKKQIGSKWKNISNFVSLNSKWSQAYLHYRYFINNERLKPKQMQFLNLVKVQNQPIYFEPKTQQKNLFNPLLMFSEDAFCLRVGYENRELIIRQCNQRFQTITGYQRKEVLNSTLNILMTEEVRECHQSKFDEWVQTGLISNEDQYTVRPTEIITVQNNILPVLKYYKCFYSIPSGLDYFCLIKVNVKGSKKYIAANPTTKSLSDLKFKLNSNLLFNKSIFSEKESMENIFVKEEIFEAKANAQQISYFLVGSRISLFVMVLCVAIISLLIKDTNNNLTSFSNQFIDYMAVYRFPIILSTNYMKSFLNVGDKAKVAQQITTATNNFMASSKKVQIKTTLFNQGLNPPKKYYPYYNYSFLANDSRSQIDLFYTIASSISTLNKLPVNRTSQQYQRFNSYLKPPYDNMMNATKYNLHSTFRTIFNTCISNQIITICIELVVFVFFTVFLLKFANSLINRMDNILLIITQFGHQQVNRSYMYWKAMNSYFHQLSSQLQSTSSNMITAQTVKRQSSFKIQQFNVQINNYSKKINKDGEKTSCLFKLRAFIIITMFLIFSTTISMQINALVQLEKLYDFQEAGFYFLRFFPVGPLVTMGCTEKYYSDTFPEEISFNPQKYDDVISALFIFGSYDYFGEDYIDSKYFRKRKNYFFGNPCQYNPTILASTGINISKCESICNGTFKQGLSAFLRYEYRLGEDCIRDKVNLTSAQLDQFTLGGTVLSAFVLDSINTWLSQFIQKISSNQQNNQIQAIAVAIIIIIIHLCANQAKTVTFLQQEYELVKQAYTGLVPEAILINQKVVRQKFIIQGIIDP